MKKLIGILLVMGLVLLVALPAMGKPHDKAKGKPQGKSEMKFSGNQMPSVDFAHDVHKKKVADCKTCHHYGVGTGTCVDCHGGDSRARSKKNAFHDSCRGCHTKMNISKPNDCNFCHKG